MKTYKTNRILATVVAAFALSAAAMVSPAQADVPLPPEVKVAVDRAFAGNLTDADRSLLVNYPEIAASVPDLAKTEISKTTAVPLTTGTLGTSPAATTAATKCNTYTGSARFKSLLGFTIYKFTHKATACSNGTKVTSHSKPTYTISEADYTVDNWSVTDKTVTGVNTSKSTSRIQVKVQQCVIKVGCYGNNYPTGTIVAKANNTADIKTTAR